MVAGDFQRPNGLCFSPDESLLYIVDTGRSDGPKYPTHIRVFEVHGDRLANGRVFADMEPGSSDGLRTDVDGNLWSGACWGGEGYDGVHCFAPDGTLIGQDPPAGALRQPLFRRREEEPAVHHLLAVAVLGVRRDERGAETLTRRSKLSATSA